MSQEGAKKLASVSTSSTLVTENNKKAIIGAKELESVTYIQYLIIFLGSVTQNGSTLDHVLALLDLGSEVNVIHPIFAKKLGLVV